MPDLLLLVPAVTLAAATAFAAGQAPLTPSAGPPVDPESRFEVVSVKPFDASGGATPQISMTPGRYNVAGLPLSFLVSQALPGPPGRFIGLPDWAATERYTIAAKAPDGAPAAALLAMVLNLLKDRFAFVMHTETREMPVYNLVLARSDQRFGPGFKETSADCRAKIVTRAADVQRRDPVIPMDECTSLRVSPGTLNVNGARTFLLAQFLTGSVGRRVIDKTGLTSYYDVALKWTPAPGSEALAPPGGAPAAPPPSDPDAPNLFTAVQEQLGLKLESARGPVEVFVIDRLERPAPD